MKTTTRSLILPLLVAAGFAAASVQAAPVPFSATDAGTLVSGPASRSITIDANTRAIHVVNGETVNFTIDGQQFTYAFNAWNTINTIDLATIAPKNVKVPQTRIYIAPNPSYLG